MTQKLLCLPDEVICLNTERSEPTKIHQEKLSIRRSWYLRLWRQSENDGYLNGTSVMKLNYHLWFCRHNTKNDCKLRRTSMKMVNLGIFKYAVRVYSRNLKFYVFVSESKRETRQTLRHRVIPFIIQNSSVLERTPL